MADTSEPLPLRPFVPMQTGLFPPQAWVFPLTRTGSGSCHSLESYGPLPGAEEGLRDAEEGLRDFVLLERKIGRNTQDQG